jgi:hypothetical protein
MVFGLFGGKSVEIAIQLDRPDRVYAVGDTVHAEIHLAAEKVGRVRGDYIVTQWVGVYSG